MRCSKCGKPVEEENTLCQECALAELPAQQTTPEAPNAEPVAEAPVEVPAEETPVEQTPEVPEQAPKKKKTKLAMILGAVALALVAALLLSWGSLEGMIAYAKSPEDYLVYVEKKAMAEGSVLDMTGDLYSGFCENLSETTVNSMESAMFLTIGQGVTDILESLTGGYLELDWLKQVSVHNTMNNAGTNKGANLSLGLNGTPVLSADVILDTENYKAYMQLPQLNDKALSVGVEDLGIDKAQVEDVLTRGQELREELAEILPDEEAFENLVRRYTQLALSKLENVERTKETLSVGGLSQKFTVLQTNVNEQLANDITLALLTEARNDQELWAFINSLDLLAKVEEGAESAELLSYEEYVAFIDEGIASCQEKSVSTDNLITIKTYVDSRHNICGRSFIAPEGEELLRFLTVTQGNDWAYDMQVEGTAVLTGSGTRNGKIFAGTYRMGQGTAVMTIEVENFDLLALNEGKLLGTFRLRPGMELLEELAESLEISAITDAGDWMLEIKTTKETADFTIYNGQDMFLSLGVTASLKELEPLALPADALTATDMTALQTWLAELDLEGLLEALKAAGVPEDYLSLLQ